MKLVVYRYLIHRGLVSYPAPRFQVPNANPAVVWPSRPVHAIHRAIEPRYVFGEANAVSLFDLRDHLLGRRRTDSAIWARRSQCFYELLPGVHCLANAASQPRPAPRPWGSKPRFAPAVGCRRLLARA